MREYRLARNRCQGIGWALAALFAAGVVCAESVAETVVDRKAGGAQSKPVVNTSENGSPRPIIAEDLSVETYLRFWRPHMLVGFLETDKRDIRRKWADELMTDFCAKVIKLRKFGGSKTMTELAFSELEKILLEALVESFATMDLDDLSRQNLGKMSMTYFEKLHAGNRQKMFPAADRAIKALEKTVNARYQKYSQSRDGQERIQKAKIYSRMDALGRIIIADISRPGRNKTPMPRNLGKLSTRIRAAIQSIESKDLLAKEPVSSASTDIESLLVRFYHATKKTNPLFTDWDKRYSTQELLEMFQAHIKEKKDEEVAREYEVLLQAAEALMSEN